MAKPPTTNKNVDAIKHDDAKRKNIPTAEYQSVLDENQKTSKQVRYPRNTVYGLLPFCQRECWITRDRLLTYIRPPGWA